jgi:hypothetical protein
MKNLLRPKPILVFFFIVLLVLNLYLMVTGKIGHLLFWVVIGIAFLFMRYGLPRMKD